MRSSHSAVSGGAVLCWGLNPEPHTFFIYFFYFYFLFFGFSRQGSLTHFKASTLSHLPLHPTSSTLTGFLHSLTEKWKAVSWTPSLVGTLIAGEHSWATEQGCMIKQIHTEDNVSFLIPLPKTLLTHFRRSSFGERYFLHRLVPKLCVLCCGLEKFNGHPTHLTLKFIPGFCQNI